jgi:hypothetical protein
MKEFEKITGLPQGVGPGIYSGPKGPDDMPKPGQITDKGLAGVDGSRGNNWAADFLQIAAKYKILFEELLENNKHNLADPDFKTKMQKLQDEFRQENDNYFGVGE